jgi:hypothetical protein
MKKLYAYKRLAEFKSFKSDSTGKRPTYTPVQALQVMYLTDVDVFMIVDEDVYWERDSDFDIQIPQDVHSTKDT